MTLCGQKNGKFTLVRLFKAKQVNTLYNLILNRMSSNYVAELHKKGHFAWARKSTSSLMKLGQIYVKR